MGTNGRRASGRMGAVAVAQCKRLMRAKDHRRIALAHGSSEVPGRGGPCRGGVGPRREEQNGQGEGDGR